MNAVDGSFGAILSLDGSAFGIGRGATVTLSVVVEIRKSARAKIRIGARVRDAGRRACSACQIPIGGGEELSTLEAVSRKEEKNHFLGTAGRIRPSAS